MKELNRDELRTVLGGTETDAAVDSESLDVGIHPAGDCNGRSARGIWNP